MNIFKSLFKKKILDISEDKALQPLPEKSIDSIPIEKMNPELNDKQKDELIQLLAERLVYNNRNGFKLEDKDPLFDDAARLIVNAQLGSTTLLQRRMKLGYNRACRLMEQMESAGIVGVNLGSKPRDVLIKNQLELQNFFDTGVLLDTNKFETINVSLFYDQNHTEIENKIIEIEHNIKEEQINLEKNQIREVLLEKERKKLLQKEVLKELIKEGAIHAQFIDKEGRREIIPQEVMDKVWNRDAGKCSKCGSQKNLEFDHIIPFSKGGATTYRNMQLLCKSCNIEKSNNIG